MKTYRRILAQLPASRQSVEEQITDLTHIRKPCTGFQAATTPRPARRNRRFPSRPTKLVAVGAALITMAASHAAVVSTASVDFLGNFQAGTLVAGDVAGVVPANQWGAATGNIGFLPQFDTLGSDVINFNWNAPDSAVIPGNVPTPGRQSNDGRLHHKREYIGRTCCRRRSGQQHRSRRARVVLL